jgi:hypothetical protein
MYTAYDNFSRQVQGAFGTMAPAHAWTALEPTTLALSVVNGQGNVAGTGEAEMVFGQDSQFQHVELQTWFSVQQGGTVIGLFARRALDGSSYYRAALYVDANNNAILKLEVNNGSLIPLQEREVTVTPGSYYHLKFRVQSSVLAAKFWQTGHPEPLNWTVQWEHTRFTNAGQNGLYIRSNGANKAISALKLSSYHINELQDPGDYDHFYTLANWRSFSNPDGSPAPAPTYPYSLAWTNNYIHLWGGINGGLNIRSNVSNGERNIVFLQSVRNFKLPGTFACKIRINGPTTGGIDMVKIVKAFYGVGGNGAGPGQYIEHDFEVCLEPDHPFFNGYPGATNPAVVCSTYSDANGNLLSRPAQPIPLDNEVFNNWFIFAFSVGVFSQNEQEIVYKSDFYMMSARSAPSFQFIGTTYTTHDPSTLYEQAYIDLHYVDTAQTSPSSPGNPQSLSVQWFYYVPQPNTLPTLL